MENTNVTRKWSDIYKMQVCVPAEGRIVGIVEDFYFKAETNALYAFRIHTPLEGDRSLPVTGIITIDQKGINIVNAEMLTRALPPLPQGQSLRRSKVVTEDGTEVGIVDDVWIGIHHPSAFYIAAFELATKRPRHAKGFTAEEVVRYEDNSIVIYDRAAKKLR